MTASTGRFSADKLELLRRLRENRPTVSTPDRIRRRADLGPVPAARQQRGLWFLDQLMTPQDKSTYNLPWTVRMRGPVRAAVLADSLTEIVRRHEVLRTVFTARDGIPYQVVRPPARVNVALLDDAAAIAAEIDRPFDLSRGPLLRAALARLGPDDHVLVVTAHHTVLDGWSLDIVRDELVQLYRAYGQGLPSPLPELEIQYSDYAAWQQELLEAGELARQVDYWRKQLTGAPGVLELPTDRPRPAVASHAGDEVRFVLPAGLADRLRALARTEQVTLFMVLLAGFQALLARWSGQHEVCVGTPVAGRDRPELAGLIGMFVNTVVLRGDLSGTPSFRDLLRRTRAGVSAAYANQDVPFDQLVEELRPDRTLRHAPLFQVMLVLQSSAREDGTLPGVELSDYPVVSHDAKFDLVLDVLDGPGALDCAIGFRTDILDPATIERLADQLILLLHGLCADPDREVHQVDLVTEADRQAVLHGVDDLPEPVRQSLPELFQSRAAATPDAVAVVCQDERLSYRELNERANRLARVLVGAGAAPERLVALALPRSADLVVAVLAVLKSGAGYLPLDPDAPVDRISYLVEDADPACVVSTSELATTMLTGVHRPVLLLDEQPLAEQPAGDLDVPVAPENLAYVIYTSGSTGRPKGVGVAHAQVVRLLSVTAPDFGFGPADVWTLFHSYAFDFSVWEMWGALAYGGTLVVVPAEVARSAREFGELLLRHEVTVLNQTPSAFRELTEVAPLRRLSVRTVVLGGEALTVADLAPWFDQLGAHCPRMINMYGITEATVHATYRRITPADLVSGPCSPIGVALEDLRLHLLDPYGRLVPDGVPGEAYLAGPGLARGYLGRPSLTAQRFVPDPFGPPGTRLYRSGDRCRRLANGELEYLGRTDHQVKIRGYRIELGEIESALLAHPGVRQAVVLAREDVPGDRRLVAYLVPVDAGQPPTVGELRSLLSTSLPAYMVPAGYLVLAALPLTTNGKLDRAALPAPDAGRPDLVTGYRPPGTPSERIIAEVWATVLGLDRTGVDDDFFDLGGHSLHATHVVARLRSEHGIEVPVAALFQTPTVAQLAARVDAGQAVPTPAVRRAIPGVDRSRYRVDRPT